MSKLFGVILITNQLSNSVIIRVNCHIFFKQKKWNSDAIQ